MRETRCQADGNEATGKQQDHRGGDHAARSRRGQDERLVQDRHRI